MTEPIHCLVFSKDRAMQLDAFIRSANKHAPYASYQALVSFTDSRLKWERPGAPPPPVLSDHQLAYEYLHNHDVEIWGDGCYLGFMGVVRAFLERHERVVFHTDDEVFYRTPSAEVFDNTEDVITLRQGRNTTYCQVLDRPQAIPATFPRWKWRDAELDFAYPLSLNACVYNSSDILPLLNFHFENPTQLEAGLACQHASFKPEYMVAPEHSCTVALPHNVVSVSSGCPRGGNPDWQPDALCQKYLDGWRIDLDAMDFSNIVAAHQEVPLKFYRP